MKINYRMALILLGGIALGGAAIQGLHAQAKPPVIVAIEISDVTDPEAWKVVTQRAANNTETVKQGGRYLARTDNITALDGTAPKRYVLIAFDSAEKAKAWYNSAGQKAVTAIRAKATKSHAFIVEGM